MQLNDSPLPEGALNELLRPYRSDWKRRERLSKFVEQVDRAHKREAIFQIAELLATKRATEVEAEPGFDGISAHFANLKAYAEAGIDAYRSQLIEDLDTRARDAELPFTIDFPRFRSRPGVAGSFDFASRTTTLNGKKLKTVDPKRVVAALLALDRRLYGRAFEAQGFIDGLYSTYLGMVGDGVGDSVNAQKFYLQYVIGMQSKGFLQDLAKGRFRGYPVDEFSVDLWRFASSEVAKTSSGHVLRLRPGRGGALWLLDSEGESRQISTIAFQ